MIWGCTFVRTRHRVIFHQCIAILQVFLEKSSIVEWLLPSFDSPVCITRYFLHNVADNQSALGVISNMSDVYIMLERTSLSSNAIIDHLAVNTSSDIWGQFYLTCKSPSCHPAFLGHPNYLRIVSSSPMQEQFCKTEHSKIWGWIRRRASSATAQQFRLMISLSLQFSKTQGSPLICVDFPYLQPWVPPWHSEC